MEVPRPGNSSFILPSYDDDGQRRRMTMNLLRGACLAAAAICSMPVGLSSPARAETAQQNVIQSHRYDRMLETNRGFRKARMRKECGPISDPQLRAGCLASFSQDEPFVGSSTTARSYRSEAGR